jgi:hypothetical protein
VLSSVDPLEESPWFAYFSSTAFAWVAVRVAAIFVFVLALLWRDFTYCGDV